MAGHSGRRVKKRKDPGAGISHESVDGYQCDARRRSPARHRIDQTSLDVLQVELSE
jgi:hypothetical protein